MGVSLSAYSWFGVTSPNTPDSPVTLSVPCVALSVQFEISAVPELTSLTSVIVAGGVYRFV